jgi:hypothetical protein
MKHLLLICLLFTSASSFAQPQGPDTLWTRTYGASGRDEAAGILQETSDGGILLVGTIADSIQAQLDILFMKIDGRGNLIWQHRFGGQEDDVASGITASPDGGYILVGYTDSWGEGSRNLMVMKLTGNGDSLWCRTFGGNQGSRGYAVVRHNNGFVIVGSSSAGTGQHFYALSIDANGDTLWTRTYARAGDLNRDEATSIISNPMGGFVVAGEISNRPVFPNSRNYDGYLLCVNDQGDTLWTRTFGDSDSDESITNLLWSNNDIFGCGAVQRHGMDSDILLARFRGNGEGRWTHSYDFGGSSDFATNLFPTDSNRIVIAGGVNIIIGGIPRERPALMDLNILGDTIWTATYPSPDPFATGSAMRTNTGQYIFVGTCLIQPSLTTEIYVFATVPENQTLTENNEQAIPSLRLFPPYPSPANATVLIRFVIDNTANVVLEIFDVSGRSVTTLIDAPLITGEHFLAFNGSNIPSGIYFVRLRSGTISRTQKIVLLK